MRGQMMAMPLTIHSLIDHGARYHGDTEIVSVETDGTKTKMTWKGISDRARQLSSALAKLGLFKGDRVATIAWNNSRHLECYFGISCGGMVCHTINPRLFPEQLIYIINHAEDRVIFFDKTFLPLIEGIREHLKTVDTFVLLSERDDNAASKIPGLVFYEDFLATGDENVDWVDVDENDASSLCYTSGTTGNPKGVLYSHRSTVLHSMVAALPDTLNISAREVMLPVVPMFHVNAWGIPYAAAMSGAKMVMPGAAMDGASIYELMEAESVTLSAGVPTVWLMLLGHVKENNLKFSSMNRTVIGGSAAPRSMIETFVNDYGVNVVHAWGMTEMSPLGTTGNLLKKHDDLPEDQKIDIRLKQGRAVYGVDLKIADDDGNELPRDGVAFGRLMVRGPWITSGYFRGEGGDVIDEDMWFDTGDVATLDPDGYMQITDRSKDVIKSGGEWISSIDVENEAIGCPGIIEAAVIAVPHPKWDERPLVIAVKEEGHSVSREDVIAHLENTLAKWQLPDDVVFVDELPHTATGKLLKTKLREEYKDYKLPSA